MRDQVLPFLTSPVQDDLDSDHDESLSQCDLPLTPSQHSSPTFHHHHHHTPSIKINHSRPNPPANEVIFEFLINPDDAILSPADDVISNGRLLPFNPPPPRRSFSLSAASTRSDSRLTESTRSETRSIIRHSRSLDCRKLRRNFSSKTESFSRNCSNRGNNNSDTKLPPWYWPVLGIPTRFPAEMELKDIKNRQYRRNIPPVSLFSGDRNNSSTSWKMLNVLSCKSHASVDVA